MYRQNRSRLMWNIGNTSEFNYRMHHNKFHQVPTIENVNYSFT